VHNLYPVQRCGKQQTNILVFFQSVSISFNILLESDFDPSDKSKNPFHTNHWEGQTNVGKDSYLQTLLEFFIRISITLY
jgi:hypothetical protein